MSNKYDIAHPLAILLATVGALVALALTLNLYPWLTLTLFLWLFWSLVALLFLADTPRRDFIQGTLRHSRFTQIYAVPTKRIVDWFWTRYCDETDKDSGPIQTFRHALTWRLYDKALLVAVVYPIFLLMLIWAISGNNQNLGKSIVMPVAIFWPDRALVLGATAVWIVSLAYMKMAATNQHLIRKFVLYLLPVLAFVFAFAFAGGGQFSFGF